MNKKPSRASAKAKIPLRSTTIKRARSILRFQQDVATDLPRAAAGRLYVAIAPFAWAIDKDPVRALKIARQKVPSHVPRTNRTIMLYDAPEGTQVNVFDGSLQTPAGASVLLVAKLDR